MTAALSFAFASANRGALTTIFMPPASCNNETTLVSYPTSLRSNSTYTFSTTKLFINHFSWGDSSCYPPTIATIDGTTRWDNGYYYSPGICPTGWTSACEISTSAMAFSTTLGSSTTGVMCCPSHWSCYTGSTALTAHGCTTLLWEGQVITSVWAAPQPTPSIPMIIPDSRSLGNYTIPADTTATCDGIPVLWQNTDIAILSLLGLPFTSTGTRTLTSSSFPTATNTITSSVSGIPKSGISTGAKAAIGVIIPIFFLALILGIFLFFRRRGKREIHHELAASMNSANWAMNEIAKKDGGELDSGARYEAETRPIVEMGAGEKDAKINSPGLKKDTPDGVFELDGGEAGTMRPT